METPTDKDRWLWNREHRPFERFLRQNLRLYTTPGCIDKRLSKVGIDTPISELVGIGQGIAGDGASNAHVAAFHALGKKTGFNVPKALPTGKLCKCHTQVLIKTGEVFDFAVSEITLNTSSKGMYGHVIHYL